MDDITYSGLRALACAAATAAFEVPGFFAADCRPEKKEVGFAITCLGATAAGLASGVAFLIGTPDLLPEVALPVVVLDATFLDGVSKDASSTLRLTPATAVTVFVLAADAGSLVVSFFFLAAALSVIRFAKAWMDLSPLFAKRGRIFVMLVLSRAPSVSVLQREMNCGVLSVRK